MSPIDSNDNGGSTPNASELLDFEPIAKSSSSGRGMMLGIFAALLLAGAGGAGLFYMGLMDIDETSHGPVPLILPPAGEVKVRPESPGGMAVPDRDKLVYGRIDGSAGGLKGLKFERLLPPPETPLQPPTVAPKKNIVEPAPPEPLKAEVTKSEPAAPPPAPAPTPTAAAKVPVVLAPSLEPVAPPSPPKESTVAVPAPAPAVVKAGQFMVQLSALKTEASAKAEWKRITKQNADILGGFEMNIQRADLGARGIFWRLRAAYLPDRKAAQDVCDKLKERKVGCLIIAP